MPKPPPDLPDDIDDFTTDDDRPGLIALLTGIGIGICLGLAIGELWSLMGAVA
jgi:hypothetical protein